MTDLFKELLPAPLPHSVKEPLSISLLTFAGLSMGDQFGGVPVESLLAVVTVSARGRVATVHADTARDSAGQLEEFHVEATPPRVFVAVAG